MSVWSWVGRVGLLLLLWLLYRTIKNYFATRKVEILADGTKKRDMSLLSHLYHGLYLRKKSPIIHVVSVCNPCEEEFNKKFWYQLMRDYLIFRSVPLIENHKFYWQELPMDKIDIDNHFTHVTLESKDFENDPLEKDDDIKENKEEMVLQAVSEYANLKNLNANFKEGCPAWSVTYFTINGKGYENKAGLYVKIHHSMVDGIMASKILEHHSHEATDETQNPTFQLVKRIIELGKQCDMDSNLEEIAESRGSFADVKRTVDTKSKKSKTKKSRTGRDRFQMTTMEFLKKLPGVILEFWRVVLWEPRVPECSLYKVLTDDPSYQMYLSSGFKISDLLVLAKKHGGTLNDLLMTIYCSALAKYLKKFEKKDIYDKLVKVYGKSLTVRFITIFNMRSLFTHDMARTIQSFKEGTSVENDLSIVIIQLPIGELSFEERFKRVKKCFDDLKTSPLAIFTAWLLRVIYSMAGGIGVGILVYLSTSKCISIFSNVRGAEIPMPAGPKGIIWRSAFATNPTGVPPSSCGFLSFMGKAYISMCLDKDTMNRKQSKEFMKILKDEVLALQGNLPDDDYDWM